MPSPFHFKRITFCVIVIALMSAFNQALAISDAWNPKKFFTHSSPTPKATAVLTFSREGKRLYLYIQIQQEKNVSNQVKVIWTCPPDSICGNSEYSLHYSGLHYKTSAYRTVVLETQDSDPLTCVGNWKVSIIDAANKEIASGSFTVKDEGVLDQAAASNIPMDDENNTEDTQL